MKFWIESELKKVMSVSRLGIEVSMHKHNNGKYVVTGHRRQGIMIGDYLEARAMFDKLVLVAEEETREKLY